MAVPLYQAKADLLRVLGHPARIRVLELLAEGELAAGELLAEIAIEAGSLSQQLAVLRRAGLVGQRRDAGTVVYSLTVPEIRHVLVAARTVLAMLPGGHRPLPPDLRSPTPAGGVAAAGATAAVVARGPRGLTAARRPGHSAALLQRFDRHRVDHDVVAVVVCGRVELPAAGDEREPRARRGAHIAG